MAEEYKKDYATMYQKIARIAYLDGMHDALKWAREQINIL